MQPKFTGLRELAEHIDSLAAQVAGAVLRAIQLDHIPSASVLTCERDLWRWAWRLRHLAANPRAQGTPDETPDVPRRVAVVLLVDLDKKRDLSWLGGQVRAAVGHAGDGWQIRHTSVHPHWHHGGREGADAMTGFPETFVETPLGTLHVWASGEHTLSAATMYDHDKRRAGNRDNPDAQRCAEQVIINRVPYTVVVHLRPAAGFPTDGHFDGRLHREHAGWGINWYGVTLRRTDRYEGPSHSAKRKAEDLLLPALAGFANSAAGRRLLGQAATARRR